jgi:gas vesicle protein
MPDVKKDMATREFVSTKFTAFNDRVDRLESDIQRIHVETTKATTELKTMITDRINQVIADFDEENAELHKRIEKIIVSEEESYKYRRTRTIGIYMAIFGAALSLVVSVITAFILNGGN